MVRIPFHIVMNSNTQGGILMNYRLPALIVSLLFSLVFVGNANAKAKLPDLKAKLKPKVERKVKVVSQAFLMSRLKTEINRELGLKSVKKLERAKELQSNTPSLKSPEQEMYGQVSALGHNHKKSVHVQGTPEKCSEE